MSGQKYLSGKLLISHSETTTIFDVKDGEGKTLCEAVVDKHDANLLLSGETSQKNCRVNVASGAKEQMSTHNFVVKWLATELCPFTSLVKSIDELPQVIEQIVAMGLRFTLKNKDFLSYNMELDVTDGYQ